MAKQTPSASVAAPKSLPVAPWMNGAAIDTMMRMGETCARACQTWQQEIARFAAARLENDGELGKQLMSCGNWAEAVKLQQDWAGVMAQDYLNQANRMIHLASSLGAQMLAPEAPTERSGESVRSSQAAE